MIKHLLYIFLVNGLLAVCAFSKPMDSKAARNISKLESIVTQVRKGDSLSLEEILFVNQCIESKDPVLVAVTSWIIGEYEKTPEQLVAKLKLELKATRSQMTSAFMQIAIEKCAARASGIEWKPNKTFVDTDNPYLFIETTRALLLANDKRGKEQLKKMEESNDVFLKTAALSLAKDATSSGYDSRALLFDERYATVLRILQQNLHNSGSRDIKDKTQPSHN